MNLKKNVNKSLSARALSTKTCLLALCITLNTNASTDINANISSSESSSALNNDKTLLTGTLLYNIQGYSIVDGKLATFNAIEFKDDTITAVYGDDFQLTKAKIQSTQVNAIDGNGRNLLPGLIDAHGHVLNYGLSLLRADLVGATSEQDAVTRVVDYANSNASLSWIQGRGWNQVTWPSNSFPTAKSLDKAFPNTPVWLTRVDGHAGWANSKAMAIAGVTKATPEVDGGSIIRDANGEPTGVFIDNAMDYIDQAIPELTLDEQKKVLTISMNALAKLGLTSVHDAGVSSETLVAYKQLATEQTMPIRVNVMVGIPYSDWQNELAKGHYQSADNKLLINSVKISADGALGSRGAALIEDYSDHPHHRGLLLHLDEDLKRYMKTAMEAGFQVNTHAIGDNANKIVLDNYQELIRETKTENLRHRIEHAQVLRLSDIPRFSELNVIASMQATHATSDKNMAEDRLGPDRIKGAYAWRKLLDAGAVIAAGSDFPVEYAEPFYGLHASVTRQDKTNQPVSGWYPDEKMTLAEALKSFTLDAAYAGHQEKLIGSIEVGKKADFIFVDRDIFKSPMQNLWQTQVTETWVNGEQVYKQ